MWLQGRRSTASSERSWCIAAARRPRRPPLRPEAGCGCHCATELAHVTRCPDEVNWHMQRRLLVEHGAADRGRNPPAGEGGETESPAAVAAVDGPHEQAVAQLDEVGKRNGVAREAAGDGRDQMHCGVDEGLAYRSRRLLGAQDPCPVAAPGGVRRAVATTAMTAVCSAPAASVAG